MHPLSMTLFIHSYIRQIRLEFSLVIGPNEAIRCRAAFIPDFSHCFVEQLPSESSQSARFLLLSCSDDHTHHYDFNFASASAFGAFRTLCLSTLSCHAFAILLHPLCSHSNQLTSPLVLLFHAFTSYSVPWL